MAVTLFSDKQACCACGACVNACPQNAISMSTDQDGFSYPSINDSLCIECGLCTTVCGFQNLPKRNFPKSCYAVSAKDLKMLKKSASGAVFAVLAMSVLKKGGAVYGAAILTEHDKFVVKHIRITDANEVSLLQGSKYVQSDTSSTFSQAKKDLLLGKYVLYAGTPCQIAGLRGFLGREFDNLLTVEVICHGVPSLKMFQDFISVLEEKKKSRITEFFFRTKNKGQGMNSCVVFASENGNRMPKECNSHLFSFMHYFLKGDIYRESCYSCPFAACYRIADITIGDYWGFHEEYPLLPNNYPISNANGVSCVLINTEVGYRNFWESESALNILNTEFDKIARHNKQLSKPSDLTQQRSEIMLRYREIGYIAVDQYYQKTCKKDRILHWFMTYIPKGVKRNIKRILGSVSAKE